MAAAKGETDLFLKETLVGGKPTNVRCVTVAGKTLVIQGRGLKVARLEDEWYDDIGDPGGVVSGLRETRGVSVDLLTFWQRVPDSHPLYSYHHEWEDIAALPVSTYEYWIGKQIRPRVRNQIRKAEREGLIVRETTYDEAFIQGMTSIFNESPVRQGRRFWHYGKDFETVKCQFSRFVYREHMVGAYLDGEMVGFMMLGNAGRYGVTGQIMSSLRHRNKTPNNAMVAKAVEICAANSLPYLVYFYWTEDSLAEFKRRCGFEKVRVPRYYVPLTWRGELALQMGAHRGLRSIFPSSVRRTLKLARASWYERQST